MTRRSSSPISISRAPAASVPSCASIRSRSIDPRRHAAQRERDCLGEGSRRRRRIESGRRSGCRKDGRSTCNRQSAAHPGPRLTPELSFANRSNLQDPHMPSTIIDSIIFGDIFSDEPMRNVWSDENRTQKYLDIEAALARVQGRLGIIPKEAADEIVKHCTIDQIDMRKLKQQTERIGYPILGVVSQLNALCRDKLGEYCHWGATTQDITDTATVLQIREGLAIVEPELAANPRAMARHAKTHPDTPMTRRRNPHAANPVT